MNRSPRHVAALEAGFTLVEVLLATLLMTVIMGALVTLTAQWLPNWNRGMVRVQKMERLATGISRVVSDLSAAELISINANSQMPMFDGTELSVTFVRTAVGPDTQPGLEFVRLVEKADDQGLALVRERSRFTPMSSDAQITFAATVVLIRSPFRVMFSYAGPDKIWQPIWRNQPLLPDAIRVQIRDSATGQTLAVSTAVTIHTNMPSDCARARNVRTCLNAKLQPGGTPTAGAQL